MLPANMFGDTRRGRWPELPDVGHDMLGAGPHQADFLPLAKDSLLDANINDNTLV